MSTAGNAATLFVAGILASATPVRAQTGSVTGTVHDSIQGGPLPQAMVYLHGTSHRGVSDAEGRFRIDSVPAGDYSLLFFHERLGQMGVSPGPKIINVRPDSEETVALATPSAATVIKSQCLLEETPRHSGAIAGRVVDGSSGLPLGGAQVTLSWQQGEDPSALNTLSLQTGPAGWYRTCSVPADVPVLLSGSFFGRQGARREVTVTEDGFTEAALPLFDHGSTQVRGRLVDRSSGEGVEGAETWLRGTPHRALTDGSGHFELGDVVPGTYMLMADHLAYGVKMDTLVIPADQKLSVEMRLDTRPIEMAPITVTAEAPPVTIDRRRGGIVITTEEIDRVRQQARDASDILRSLHIPGVIVRPNSTTGRVCVGFTTGQVKMIQSGCVEMLVFINDVRATDPELALRMPPDAIERMVIYKPLQAGNLFGLGGGNGVWMIYTRGN